MIITFVVCLVAGSYCSEQSIPLQAEVGTPYRCIQVAQGEIARWLNEHPGHVLEANSRIRCTSILRRERTA